MNTNQTDRIGWSPGAAMIIAVLHYYKVESVYADNGTSALSVEAGGYAY
jgi:hypothetical protein